MSSEYAAFLMGWIAGGILRAGAKKEFPLKATIDSVDPYRLTLVLESGQRLVVSVAEDVAKT